MHGGVLPLLASLAVAIAARGSRLAWLGVVAGYATVIALTTGFAFEPLTVRRKVTLLVLLAPLAGLALDAFAARRPAARWLVVAASAALAPWLLETVLAQRPAAEAVAVGFGVAAFAGVLVWLLLRVRGDGAAVAASGLGLGLASGFAALLSASLGAFGIGLALAAAAAALAFVQFGRARSIPAGFTGALTVAFVAGMTSIATLVLAQLPWHALALLLLPAAVPAFWPATGMTPRRRIVLLSLAATAAAIVPIAAAYLAAVAAPA